MSEKQDIRALSKAELKTWFTESGEKAFRAKQVMSGFGKSLRAPLGI